MLFGIKTEWGRRFIAVLIEFLKEIAPISGLKFMGVLLLCLTGMKFLKGTETSVRGTYL